MKKLKSKFTSQFYTIQQNFIKLKLFRIIFMVVILSLMLSTTVLASSPPAASSDNVWTKAKEIMQDVYSQIILISTIAAVVTAAVALLLMNFSKNSRTVDESRAWLKRIIISWAILNGLGFIMAYVTPFFTGGQWSG